MLPWRRDLGLTGDKLVICHFTSERPSCPRPDQSARHVIHVVKTHCSKVVAAHATKFKAMPFVLGVPDILKPFGRFPNNSEKDTLVALLVRGQFVWRCR
jgi:hypothetical protein